MARIAEHLRDVSTREKEVESITRQSLPFTSPQNKHPTLPSLLSVPPYLSQLLDRRQTN